MKRHTLYVANIKREQHNEYHPIRVVTTATIIN